EKEGLKAFLDLQSLVYDTQMLGLFTGSRVSEYAQSKGARDKVSRVPARPGTPANEAMAVAFVASDFEFLSAEGHKLTHEVTLESPHRAVQLNITFRHDKSGRSYTVRKYGRGSHELCPITAAVRLLQRATILQIAPKDPICAYQTPKQKQRKWLQAREVTSIMRLICLATYKDPEHYLHKNYTLMSSHSNRVTAAVALSQTGMTIDDIAQRLRWKPESVAFYLRESARDIGQFTANAISGAQRDFVHVDYTALDQ
ncbi:MAG: hypothetical protein ACRCT2_14470, partial [Plesiomonas shigelloides]